MRLPTPCSLLPIPCLLAFAAAAQQPWQHLQTPTAAEVQHTWTTPPPEYGPEPYYGLNGPVDATIINRDLDTMQHLGYTAVTVQAGFGMPFDYLSPQYFTFFKSLVAAAKQRNMRIWIVDDAGYPSGFAGGRFTQLRPDLRMQALVVTARIPATPGDPIKQSVSPNTVAVTATNSIDQKSITIPVTNNAIDWTPPAGNWTVTVVEHIFSTSPTRSDTNPKRVKDGSQSLEDYLDPAATQQYLDFTHNAYKQAVGDEFGKTILGFRGDEPDYSIAGLPWTPKFFDTFQRLKGYDIRPQLATFAPFIHTPGHPDARPADLTPEQKRAKADYYDVFSQLFRDGFFKPQGIWCAQNHLEYQVHLNHEEMEMQLTRSEGSFFRDMQYVEVPGIDTIWHQIWTDTISDFPRLASSVSHVYGHPRAFTESFAAYRPEPDVTMARYILNEQFVRGINLVETMYFPATTGGERSGPSKLMQDPDYPALMAYVRRMSYLLSMGRPDANVALYLPSASMWLGDAASDTQFVSTERLLSEHQIDFDIVDEDFLGESEKCPKISVSCKEDRFPMTASGSSYKTILLPNLAALSQSALLRLQLFVTTGAKVLILGRTPSLIYNKNILDARPSTPADFTAFTIVPETLPETPTPPAQPPAAPPTPMAVPPAILTALTKAVGPQQLTLDTPDTALRILRRQWKDAELLLLFNESAAPIAHTLTLAHTPGRVEIWDPQTATITNVQTQKAGTSSSLSLDLKPYETRVYLLH